MVLALICLLGTVGRLRLTCNQDAYAHRRFETGRRLNQISIVYVITEWYDARLAVGRLVRTAGNLISLTVLEMVQRTAMSIKRNGIE